MSTATVTKKRRDHSKQFGLHFYSPGSKQKDIPLAIRRAEGEHLYDYDGKKNYMDFSSGLMNVNIGHEINVTQKLWWTKMQQVSYHTKLCPQKYVVTWVKKNWLRYLLAIDQTLFTVCGATALKMHQTYSFIHRQTQNYCSLQSLFMEHPTELWLQAVNPRKPASDSQQIPNVVHVEDPYCYRCPWSKRNELLQPGMCKPHRTWFSLKDRKMLQRSWWKVKAVHPVVSNILRIILKSSRTVW